MPVDGSDVPNAGVFVPAEGAAVSAAGAFVLVDGPSVPDTEFEMPAVGSALPPGAGEDGAFPFLITYLYCTKNLLFLLFAIFFSFEAVIFSDFFPMYRESVVVFLI